MPTFPLKTYLIAAAAVAALSWLGWFALHERKIEHAKDVAVATAAVARVTKADVVIEAKANTEIQHEQIIYKQIVALPPVGDLGIVCGAPRSDTVPSPATSDGSGQRTPAGLQGELFDPSRDILTRSRDSDALVADLQSEIATLRAEMAAAHEAHR